MQGVVESFGGRIGLSEADGSVHVVFVALFKESGAHLLLVYDEGTKGSGGSEGGDGAKSATFSNESTALPQHLYPGVCHGVFFEL